MQEIAIYPVDITKVKLNLKNPRVFVDEGKLEGLVSVYRQYLKDGNTILPDPPVIGGTNKEVDTLFDKDGGPEKLKVFHGERRILAARKAGVKMLRCRIIACTEKESLEYMLAANDFEPLTSIEKALAAAELEAAGYSTSEIQEIIGASPFRYIAVGRALDRSMFVDTVKLCDPPITYWEEALSHGMSHFIYCFQQWDMGAWDYEDCKKEFRKSPNKGTLPLDNKAKGLRLSTSRDGRELNIIGKLPLDLYDDQEAIAVVSKFTTDLHLAVMSAVRDREVGFGDRICINYNPDTIST